MQNHCPNLGPAFSPYDNRPGACETTTEYPVNQLPEPSSLVLVLLAFAVLVVMRRKRNGK